MALVSSGSYMTFVTQSYDVPTGLDVSCCFSVIGRRSRAVLFRSKSGSGCPNVSLVTWNRGKCSRGCENGRRERPIAL